MLKKWRKQQVGGDRSTTSTNRSNETVDESVFLFANTEENISLHLRFVIRSMKRWCCLFTSWSTRVVLIQNVPSWERDDCVAAITKFITPKKKRNIILRDNGTGKELGRNDWKLQESDACKNGNHKTGKVLFS